MSSAFSSRTPAGYGSAQEMAAYAGLSTTTIRRLVRSGKLPGSKFGRRLSIRYEDLHRLGKESPARVAVTPTPSALDSAGKLKPLGPGEASWTARRSIEALDAVEAMGEEEEQAATLAGLLEALDGGLGR